MITVDIFWYLILLSLYLSHILCMILLWLKISYNIWYCYSCFRLIICQNGYKIDKEWFKNVQNHQNLVSKVKKKVPNQSNISASCTTTCTSVCIYLISSVWYYYDWMYLIKPDITIFVFISYYLYRLLSCRYLINSDITISVFLLHYLYDIIMTVDIV